MLILTSEEVRKLINMTECIEIVEKAFIEHANGMAYMPNHSIEPEEDGITVVMPAYLKESKILGCKTVSFYRNSEKNHPSIVSKIALQDTDTGEITCLMDGNFITSLRTGAASAVATKHLATDKKSMVLAVFGSGTEARTQLEAILCVRNIIKINIFSTNKKSAEKFANEIKTKYNIETIITDNAELAVKNADIICTSSASKNSIFNSNIIKEGVHINSIGGSADEINEIDTMLVSKSKFIGESYESEINVTGDLSIPLKEDTVLNNKLYSTIGEIANGATPGRINDDEVTIFKSTGLTIQDTAVADYIYKKAIEKGIGKIIDN